VKDIANELGTNSKNKNIKTGINWFQKCYQPRTNLTKDKNHNLPADSHNILNSY
jgi:hypothetical protein